MGRHWPYYSCLMGLFILEKAPYQLSILRLYIFVVVKQLAPLISCNNEVAFIVPFKFLLSLINKARSSTFVLSA